MTTDHAFTRSVVGLISAAALGAELRRTGTTPWTLWLGYLSHGGTLSFSEVDAALAGNVLVSASDFYLLEQARLW